MQYLPENYQYMVGRHKFRINAFRNISEKSLEKLSILGTLAYNWLQVIPLKRQKKLSPLLTLNLEYKIYRQTYSCTCAKFFESTCASVFGSM